MQVLKQPSSSSPFWSSHCSPSDTFTTPSPHAENVQSRLHNGDSPRSSHSSEANTLRVPSPHSASVQLASQVADAPWSSHASPATVLVTPSPHTGREQSTSQVSVARSSSQNSPALALCTPSPQVAVVQSASHSPVSPPVPVPSPSQTSPGSIQPFPHSAGKASPSMNRRKSRKLVPGVRGASCQFHSPNRVGSTGARRSRRCCEASTRNLRTLRSGRRRPSPTDRVATRNPPPRSRQEACLCQPVSRPRRARQRQRAERAEGPQQVGISRRTQRRSHLSVRRVR